MYKLIIVDDEFDIRDWYIKVYYGNDSSSASAKENSTNRYNTLYEKTNSLGIYEKINANKEDSLLTLLILNYCHCK